MPSLRPPPEYAISEAEIERRITNFMRRYGG
jgi:hypothetical protein